MNYRHLILFLNHRKLKVKTQKMHFAASVTHQKEKPNKQITSLLSVLHKTYRKVRKQLHLIEGARKRKNEIEVPLQGLRNWVSFPVLEAHQEIRMFLLNQGRLFPLFTRRKLWTYLGLIDYISCGFLQVGRQQLRTSKRAHRQEQNQQQWWLTVQHFLQHTHDLHPSLQVGSGMLTEKLVGYHLQLFQPNEYITSQGSITNKSYQTIQHTQRDNLIGHQLPTVLKRPSQILAGESISTTNLSPCANCCMESRRVVQLWTTN